MPRPGGEPDKLGNRYEGIWTVQQIPDLLSSGFEFIEFEPLGDAGLGIEFVIGNHDDSQQYHSVKRQSSSGEWTLAKLARPDSSTGRSILSDFHQKIASSSTSECVFVSGTSASEFERLCDEAQKHAVTNRFKQAIESSGELTKEFENRILPLVNNDTSAAHAFLRQLSVVTINERTLIRNVEQRISSLIFCPERNLFSPKEVRILLGDFILDNLGNQVRQNDVREYLDQHGFAKRDWIGNPVFSETFQKLNSDYLRLAEYELINDVPLERSEARDLVTALSEKGGHSLIILSAPAGMGKSCVMAQGLKAMESSNVVSLAIRLDRHGDVSSTKQLGTKLGLPESPVVTLAGVASGRQCVFFIDQLDAVSQVSGRYPELWDVFDSLCQEVEAYPNTSLVIGCRDFDLQNDSRLRRLNDSTLAKTISISLLSLDEVKNVIKASANKSELEPISLTVQQYEMLRTPFHLFLFVNGLSNDHTQNSFETVGELLERYWSEKERRVRQRLDQDSSGWTSVIDRLCKRMSESMTLYAPHFSVDDWRNTVNAMLTEHVLVQDENQLRFFHESFFDYAFARRYAASGKSVLALLFSTEQHLFRRSQVRQILAFLRDHDPNEYHLQLSELLNSDQVRYHIKRMVLSWLGNLSSPTIEEWLILKTLMSNPDWIDPVLVPMVNRSSWFEFFYQHGVFADWLSSDNETLINRGMWFINMPTFAKEQSAAVADLLSCFLDVSPAWSARIRGHFRFGNCYQSRPIQILFLKLLEEGVFDESEKEEDRNVWECIHDSGKKAPVFCLEVICRWLDRKIAKYATNLTSRNLEGDRRAGYGAIEINQVTRAMPREYVELILPRVKRMVSLSLCNPVVGLSKDNVWGYLSSHGSTDVSGSLLQNLEQALGQLVESEPDYVTAIITEFFESDSLTFTDLLLRVMMSHPEVYANRCLEYLTLDKRRLDIGYNCWGGDGNPHAALSREAISKSVPHAAQDQRTRLESILISPATYEDWGINDGWHQRLLLEAFGEAYLSPEGKQQLRHLREKFPEQNTEIIRQGGSMLASAKSPVASNELEEFSDTQWLEAMRKFDYGWEERDQKRIEGKSGSAVELSRALQPIAMKNRMRFAGLIEQMDDAIRPEYFAAILDGICGQGNMNKEARAKEEEDFALLETETVLTVVRRLHCLPNRPSGKSICNAFRKLSDRSIPDDDLKILAFYAIEDPDPESDAWVESHLKEDSQPGEEYHQHGFNTVRGYAAWTIASLLFGDFERMKTYRPAISLLVKDHSISVRTCAVETLLPLFNHDRDEAVEFFLLLCNGADVIFGCHTIEEFLRYATRTHYLTLRDLLQKQLRSEHDSSVVAASRQICLAAFSDDTAEEDAKLVRTGTESMRKAAAGVYAHNVDDDVVGEVCRQRLAEFFNDESEHVQAEAADCFRLIGSNDLGRFTPIIESYVDSKAFPMTAGSLIFTLDQSSWCVPDITIKIAEIFIRECGDTASDLSRKIAREASHVSNLVVRLYTQSSDEAIRCKCLDMIDEMEKHQFYGIDSQLREYDR